MKKKGKVTLFSFIGAGVLLVMLGALYVNSIGYNNVKHMYHLESAGKSVIRIDSDMTSRERYLTKEKSDPKELLKSRMEREGWVYSQQEGSGYFFKKDGREEIVTTQQWNHFYIIYSLNAEVANLED
ncbi:type II toxin-antitoxin system HicA family toxin [Paenibacillus piscarius]|uniref:type II toxin-antitoxin system HicA family toxin n=1 Tax=Paenibacillus piscarius TaxID=1089681 RepID=UPI001EE79936|nr:type II toxin-antitoxin system HicA family toxin [Paenibacillus piscarius]